MMGYSDSTKIVCAKTEQCLLKVMDMVMVLKIKQTVYLRALHSGKDNSHSHTYTHQTKAHRLNFN